MNVSILICTYGDPAWGELAYSHAYPSAVGQGARDVIVVHADEGISLAEVRNTAAEAASGDWLCFLDADDELAPGYIVAMNEAFVGWDVHHYRGNMARGDGIYPNILLVPAVSYVHAGVGRVDPPRVLNDGRPLSQINRAVIGTLVPRSLFLEVGGFPEEPIYEDFALWLKCERAGATLVDVPEAVYRAYRRPGSRNLQPSPVAQEVYWRLRREHEAWESQSVAAS